MLRRMIYVLGNLCVYPENMKRNLEKSGGTVFSKKCCSLWWIKGMPRDSAYRMVQRHALKVGREGGDLKEGAAQDPEIRRTLAAQEIEKVWGVSVHLTNIDYLRRVFH